MKPEGAQARIRGRHRPGELMVKFRVNPRSPGVRAAHARIGARVLREFRHVRWTHVKLPPTLSVQSAMAFYRRMPGVEAVEPNYVFQADAIPDDELYEWQWGMDAIHAPEAWDATTGDPGVVVAVLDTGVDYTHEDLADNMWVNPGETGLDALGNDKESNGTDDDGNGYVDDVYGINTAYGDADPFDDHMHGTHVAGIVGAAGNNTVGVAGVNWAVRIMALKFLDSEGGGDEANAVTAYEYAIDLKQRGDVNLRVINDSWGGPDASQALQDIIAAAGNEGILSCCASGNDGLDNDAAPHYPSNYDLPSVLAVGSSDLWGEDAPSYFSNYGATTVDLAAPGEFIMSTIPPDPLYGDYATFDGTSMATPHVSGAAALLVAKYPAATVDELKSTLMQTVDRVSAWAGKCVSGGRLNLARALANVDAARISGRVTEDGAGLGGVAVQVTGPVSASAETFSDGTYTVFGVDAGTYTVTPAKMNHIITPASRTVTVAVRERVMGVDFTSVPVEVVVTAPNGGEVWGLGSTKYITWSSRNVTGDVKIELSRDGGATYPEVLFANTANDGSEPWPVTGAATMQARLRITAVSETAVSDTSNSDFVIGTTHTIRGRITQGGAGLSGVRVDAVCPIAVDQTASPHVSIPDADEAGVVVPISVPQIGMITGVHVSVDISHSAAFDLGVALIHPDNTTVDLTTPYTLDQVDLITTYPDESEPDESLDALIGKPTNGIWRLWVSDWMTEELGTLNSWRLRLEGSLGSATVTAADGTYELTDLLPGTYTVTPSVSGRAFDPASRTVTVGPDQDGVDFTTTGITVIAPNGGEVWGIGHTANITWSSAGVSGNVKIELSRDGGATFPEVLFADTANDGSEPWPITGPPASQARIRVSTVDGSAQDTNDADFAISAPATLSFTVQPEETEAGAEIAPAVAVAVEDDSGRTITTAVDSITLSLGSNPGGGTLSGTLIQSAVSGAATFAGLSINKAGSGYTVTASATGLTGATSASFNITPAGAVGLSFAAQPRSTVAGVSLTPSVQVAVQDAFGNTVPGAADAITLAIGTNPTDGILSGDLVRNAVDGVAAFSDLSLDRVGTGYTLAATAAGLTGAISNAFTIRPALATHLDFTVEPADAVAGAAISPAVKVAALDRFENVATLSIHTVSVAIDTDAGGGTLSGTKVTNTSAGVATFSSLRIDKAGSGYTLAATATGLAGATSAPIDILTGAPLKLAFVVQPSNAVAGAAITPAVSVAVQDAAGNVVPTAANSIRVAFAYNPSGGTLSGTKTVSATNGIATFPGLNINRVGTGYKLWASAVGLRGITSTAFNVTAP